MSGCFISTADSWQGRQESDAVTRKDLEILDGSIWAKGKTIDGVPIGDWKWFRKDGTTLRSGRFENGEQVGEWITYDKTGKRYKVTRMKSKSRKRGSAPKNLK